MDRLDPEDPDRPTGLLTASRRNYLLGNSGIDPQTQRERNARAAIRDRLENALLDASLLMRNLDDRDIERALRLSETQEVPDEELSPSAVRATQTVHFEERAKGIVDLLALIYYVTADEGGETPSQYRFENLLQRGIRRARNRQYSGDAPPVDINLKVKELPESAIEEILEKIETESYDDLTEGEARLAVRTIMESEETGPGLARQAWIERLEHLRGPPPSAEDAPNPPGKSFEERVEEAKERMQSENGDGTDEDS